MHVLAAMSVEMKAAGILIYTAIVAPLIGWGINRVAGGWHSYGGGPFAILSEPHGRGGAAAPPLDPAIQAAEVRQMLEAKAERRKERGEPGIDVEAESARLLAAAAEHSPAGHDEELRAEVRGLVVARNERRLRAGLDPLDVKGETERQLAELGG
jgi:hypothetical protein